VIAVPCSEQPVLRQPKQDELWTVAGTLSGKGNGWNGVVTIIVVVRIALRLSANPDLAKGELVKLLETNATRLALRLVVLELLANSEKIDGGFG
jgi:hypothetical protein